MNEEQVTVPIQTLNPTTNTLPSANHQIHAIVTLAWPYSASNQQCALLLADPDFRLRSRKGQVRVRFTGASAHAVAQAQIGIGDEVFLKFAGATWDDGSLLPREDLVRTPGKSVEGELVFKRKLLLKVKRSLGGDDAHVDVDVDVDVPFSPPILPGLRSPERMVEALTPLARPVSTPRQLLGTKGGLDGFMDNGVPVYSSPAFVKRLRLAGETSSFWGSSYDPFADEDVADDNEDRPTKRQRVSFEGVRWRQAERSPSPVKDRIEESQRTRATEVDSDFKSSTMSRSEQMLSTQSSLPPLSTDPSTISTPSKPAMLPPPRPQLEIPPLDPFYTTPRTGTESTQNGIGPSTPKLQPVESSTLPLPSPFPTETNNSPFVIVDTTASTQSARSMTQPDEQEFSSQVKESQPLTLSQLGEEEAPLMVESTNIQPSRISTPSKEPEEDEHVVELLDDESESEWFFEGSGRDAAEDSAMDVMYADDVEEIIDPFELDAMSDDESGSNQDDSSNEDSADIISRPDHVKSSRHRPRAIHDNAEDQAAGMAKSQDAHDQPSDLHLHTPRRSIPAITTAPFGLDGTTSPLSSNQATPQSEKDRVMARTLNSLFGFAKPSETTSEADLAQDETLIAPDSPLPSVPRAVVHQSVDAMVGDKTASAKQFSSDAQSELIHDGNREEFADRTTTSILSTEGLSRPSRTEVIELGSSPETSPRDLLPTTIAETQESVEEPTHQIRQDGLEVVRDSFDTASYQPRQEGHAVINHSNVQQDSVEYVTRVDTDVDMNISSEQDVTAYGAVQSGAEITSMFAEWPQSLDHHTATESYGAEHIEVSNSLDSLPFDSIIQYPQIPELNNSVSQGEHMTVDLITPITVQGDIGFLGERENGGNHPPSSIGAEAPSLVGHGQASEEPLERGNSIDHDIQPTDTQVLAAANEEAVSLNVDQASDNHARANDIVPNAEVDLDHDQKEHFTSTETLAEDLFHQTQHAQRPVEIPLYPSLPAAHFDPQTIREMDAQTDPLTSHEEVNVTGVAQFSQATQESTLAEETHSKGDLVDERHEDQSMHVQDSEEVVQLSRQQPVTKDAEMHDSLAQNQHANGIPRPTESVATTSPENDEEVESVIVNVKKTPARKTRNNRFSIVPDSIKEWFSPRRSNRLAAGEDTKSHTKAEQNGKDATKTHDAVETTAKDEDIPAEEDVKKTPFPGFSTSLGYFTPLSILSQLVNPSSQQTFANNTVDVFAVVTEATKDPPQRAKAGPKDFFTIFRAVDMSMDPKNSVRIEIFRPWMATLPVAHVGDVVLLRTFVVKSRKRLPYLLSTDASAWCVWRYEEDVSSSSSSRRIEEKPVWAKRLRSASISSANGTTSEKDDSEKTYNVREEVKGPPIEFGEEEKDHAKRLREWWLGTQK